MKIGSFIISQKGRVMQVTTIIITLLYFAHCDELLGNKSLFSSTFEKLECVHNPAICLNPICVMNLTTDRQKAHLTFGCTLKKECPNVMVRVKTLIKTVRHRKFVPGPVNGDFDLCAIVESQDNPVLRIFLPGIVDNLHQIIHTCPYTGRFMVENLEIDGTKLQAFGATREFITEVSMLRGKYMPIITIKLFGTSGLPLSKVPNMNN